MAPEKLFEKLNYLKAYRKNRLEAAHWVLSNPKCLPALLEFCFKNDGDINFKAAWVLEFVCIDKIQLLLPHLDYFFENLPRVTHESALRSLAKICELLTIRCYKNKDTLVINSLNESHKNIMTECSFDWLITNKKVACQAHAMLSLYYLGNEIKWIHPELKVILQQHIHHQSAGYKARAKNILKHL
ncbi:adenylosuccinate lyase [Aequorivita sp. Q41]|uniref:adenylosuccinate lyase n=1 Tax=Aequorivita sp. Q41 TaxID=3153300 RepID=UPI0032427D7C